MNSKICRVCTDSNFSKDFIPKKNLCRDCNKILVKEHRLKNIEKYKARDKAYHNNNREKRNSYNKTYWENNRSRIAESRSKSYQENIVQRREARKLYNKTRKDVLKTQRAKYRQNNKEKFKVWSSRYYWANTHKAQETSKNWRKMNREYLREYKRQRALTDPLYRMALQLRSSIRSALKRGGVTKTSKTVELLGADVFTVQAYLVNTAIRNYGFYDPEVTYHIDHVIPCSSAKTKEELIKLQRYTNLQYLYPKDNLSKGKKIL